MNHNDFINIVDATLKHCCDLLLTKGSEYSASANDRLAAFKQAAALERTTPQRALFGMLAKHLVSIQNMCDRRIRDYSKEQWLEKIGDAINYLILLQGIVEECYQEAKHEKH